MNLFVGNLSHQVTEQELRTAFEAFGQVNKASIITDKFSGEPRGFAFVEMSNKAEGIAAINGMNGKELNGRALNVSEARPREDRGGRPGGGGGFGGGRGGGGGRRDGGGGGGRRGW